MQLYNFFFFLFFLQKMKLGLHKMSVDELKSLSLRNEAAL